MVLTQSSLRTLQLQKMSSTAWRIISDKMLGFGKQCKASANIVTRQVLLHFCIWISTSSPQHHVGKQHNTKACRYLIYLSMSHWRKMLLAKTFQWVERWSRNFQLIRKMMHGQSVIFKLCGPLQRQHPSTIWDLQHRWRVIGKANGKFQFLYHYSTSWRNKLVSNPTKLKSRE